MPGGPAPKIRIVSPKPDEEFVGEQTKAPDDRFKSLDCMQDRRKRSITLAADNWTVQPKGQGVLVVVDGVYAKNVHDLTKPIMLADLEPYEQVDNNATFAVQGPMYECGPHWIAAVPTAADGHMLPVAPTVTWFFNRSVDYATRDEDARTRQTRLGFGLPVVNWPLLGSLVIGDTWRSSLRDGEVRSGFVLSAPKRPVFEWAMATPPASCSVEISHLPEYGNFEDEVRLPTRGAVVLPSAYLRGLFLIDSERCGGLDAYRVTLYAEAPTSPKHRYAWPLPGSDKAEDYWSSPEGREQLQKSLANHDSGGGGGGGGGGGKCKAQCRSAASSCRQSCRGAKCANDCNRDERSCQASC